MYYHTPRFWLSGSDSNNNPLTKEQVFEEVMTEYVNKTTTVEKHPHLGTPMVFIHPCRHAEVIQTLTKEAMKNNKDIGVEQYMFVFLKFISSVVPSLEMDFTTDIDL